MSAPRLGKPVRGSRTGRPIMVILDYLGRRWALRVRWELIDGALNFNELQRRCGAISPSVLSQRLREGLSLGTLERDGAGRYRLSADGRRLSSILRQLDAWADRWAAGRGGRTAPANAGRRRTPGPAPVHAAPRRGRSVRRRARR